MTVLFSASFLPITSIHGTLQTLKDANLINQNVQRVKVMLSGEITRAVTLKGIAATKGARAAIEAAGGKFEE